MDTLPVRAEIAPVAERGPGGGYAYQAAPEPTLGGLVAALLRHKLLILASVVVAGGLGVAYTLYSRAVYEATSVVRFETERVDLPQLVQLVYSENLISTELEVLRGRSAAVAVIDSLGLRARLVSPRHALRSGLFAVLRVSPSADSGDLELRRRADGAFDVARPGATRALAVARIGDTTSVAGVTLALAPAARALPVLRLRVDQLEDAIKRFGSALGASRPARDADLIAIRVRENDPIQAADAANLLAQNVVAERQQARRGRTGAAVGFLQLQGDTLGRQLRAAEDSLRNYQQRARVVDAPEEARVQVGRLAQLQAEVAGLRAERDALAGLVKQLRWDTAGQALGGQAPSRRLMAFPSLLRNQTAAVLLGTLAQVETERADLMIRRTPSDSDVQVLSRRVREIEVQIEGIANSYLQGLTNQVATLQAEATRFSAQLNALPEKELQVARRERDAKVLTDLSVLVQTRLKEAQISDAGGDPQVRVADAAAPALKPVRPKLPLNAALSVVLGLLVGVMGSLVREQGDRTLRSRADALAVAGLPVLGAIPRVNHQPMSLPWRSRPPREQRLASLLVTGDRATPEYLESFNQLFASLALVYRARPMKVVVFTSPLPGEGKTLSAINFALTGAQRGLRVLLVDADLRCGVVNDVLGCDREPGLAELLEGKAPLGDVLCRLDVGGEARSLGVLPTGKLQKSPGGLLTPRKLQDVLGGLVRPVDFVVIDTPPVNLLADAALVGSAADAVILVVRAGHTKAEDLRFAMEQLEAAKAPVVGTLLNDIDLRKHARYDGAYRYIGQAKRYYVGAG